MFLLIKNLTSSFKLAFAKNNESASLIGLSVVGSGKPVKEQ